jgi:heme exporter protein B
MVKVPVQAPWALLFLVVLSNLALAAATTLLASIVAESDRKASIFAVISVPILFPALLIAVELTKKCLFAEPSAIILSDFTPLIGFTGAMLVAGGLLIENLWN